MNNDSPTPDGLLASMWKKLFPPKRKRVACRFVPYAEGNKLVLEGWTIAPEEDMNKVLGWVHLELLEPKK